MKDLHVKSVWATCRGEDVAVQMWEIKAFLSIHSK